MKRLFYISALAPSICLCISTALADSHSTNAKGFFSSDINVHGVLLEKNKDTTQNNKPAENVKNKVEDSFVMKENEAVKKEGSKQEKTESHGFTKAEIAKRVYSSTQLDEIVETIDLARENAPANISSEAKTLEDVQKVINSAEKLSNETHKKQIKKNLPQKEKYTF